MHFHLSIFGQKTVAVKDRSRQLLLTNRKTTMSTKKKTIISFDFDDVLVDTNIVPTVLKEFNHPLGDAKTHINIYDWTQFSQEIVDEIHRRFETPSYNKGPRVLKDAERVVSEIIKMGFDVVVTTARTYKLHEVTDCLVKDAFPGVKEISYVRRSAKSIALRSTQAALHIDDMPKHVSDAVSNANAHGVLFSNEVTLWNHKEAEGFKKNSASNDGRKEIVISNLSDLPSLVEMLLVSGGISTVYKMRSV